VLADGAFISGSGLLPSLEAKDGLVVTLGSPSGLDLTLANGLLSGKREEGALNYVQTTAPISPGSSGGGLFDGRGNLVGITTLVWAGRERLNQSLNFAIPAQAFWQP
jgi:S1-C subfamily serine protease